MTHDVFISHAYKDKSIADAICEKLESAGVRCWIAPRNISAGEDWTKAIRNAIESARALLLVFSDNANVAPHVEREIANAFYTGEAIIAFRLTTALPRREFLFYLSGARWYDAGSQPPEQHLDNLAAGVSSLLSERALPQNRKGQLQRMPDDAATPNPWDTQSAISRFRVLRIIKYAAIATSVVGVAGLAWLWTQQTNSDSPQDESGWQSGSHRAVTAPARTVRDGSESAAHYTFTRLGLWVATSPTPSASVQPPAQGTPSSSPADKPAAPNDSPLSPSTAAAGPANASDLAPSGFSHDTTGGSEQTPAVYDATGGKSKPDRPARLTNHHGHHRGRSRAMSFKRRFAIFEKLMRFFQ